MLEGSAVSTETPAQTFARLAGFNTDLRVSTAKNVGRIDSEECRRRFTKSMALPIKPASELSGKYRGQKLIICGGGPSIEDTLPDIKRQLRLSKRVKVLALNKTHDWLLSKGLQPDFGCMADPFPHVAAYQTPQKGTKYLLGSILHDDTLAVFEKTGWRDCYLWHPVNADEGDMQWFDAAFPGRAAVKVSGKSTVGLRILTFMGKLLEFDTLELHGYDSCDAPKVKGQPRKLYPYKKPVLEASFKDSTMMAPDGAQFHFQANEHMARQSYEFFDSLEAIAAQQIAGKTRMFNITVAGDGAIPWMAWKIGIHANPAKMEAKYGAFKHWDYAEDRGQNEPFYDENAPKEVSLQTGDMPWNVSIPALDVDAAIPVNFGAANG